MSNNLNTCRIDRLPAQSTLEFAAYPTAQRRGGETLWPQAPGAVRFDAQQRPQLLHFAPGRWLAPDPSPETRALLAQAAQQGDGALLDVTGKWDALVLRGPGATRLLACELTVETVLQDRDCAAVTLFDCPATLARAGADFALWVQSSYTKDFIACAERFRTSLEART
jgi:heterotetrameric sarcosine oxidase gamma subunit